jgi:hypothetical protein|tara:strand:- start:42 stop:1328 length:1287 start_codon:yes stop_codon:yes gene_type:complete
MAGREVMAKKQTSLIDRIARMNIPSPLEVGRKLGLNIPNYQQARQAAVDLGDVLGPGADIKGMVQDSSKVMPNLRQGNYLDAMGNMGMAAAAIPMMAIPGTVAGVKKGVQGMLSPQAERVAALRAEANAARFGEDVAPVNTDYRGHHTAPLREGKNTLDDMSDIYPDDIYDPSVAGRYYGHGGDSVGIDNKSAEIISKARGNPDGEIEVFRAAPKGTNAINDGDWVTVNKDYAKAHGDSWVDNGEYDIVSKKVKVSDLATDGNSIHEFGYSPKLADDADSKLARAKEQNWETDQPVYHGTGEDFKEFDPERSIGGQYWSTTNKAEIDAGEVGAQGKGVVKEMYHKIKNPAGWDEYDKYGVDELISQGYDGIKLPDGKGHFTYVAFEPNQYRETKAMFDPAKKTSRNLLAGAAGLGVIAPTLLQDDEYF